MIVLAVVGVLLLAVPGVLTAGETGPSRLDHRLQAWVDAHQAGSYGPPLAIDSFAEWPRLFVVVAGLGLVCVLARRWRLGLVVVAGIGLTGVLAIALKGVFDRRIHEGFLSYPSGHTAILAAVGLAAGLVLADLLRLGRVGTTVLAAAPAMIGGAAMAWAQVSLAAHYPTDTVGGLGCALVVVPTLALLGSRTRRPRPAVRARGR